MSNNATTFQPIQIGDTVACGQTFIERHGRYSGSMTYARGKVNALHRVAGGIILADIDWNPPGLPKRVDVKNLIKVTSGTY
jgi:hypothetical protein